MSPLVVKGRTAVSGLAMYTLIEGCTIYPTFWRWRDMLLIHAVTVNGTSRYKGLMVIRQGMPATEQDAACGGPLLFVTALYEQGVSTSAES
jgi:hypothetical protein